MTTYYTVAGMTISCDYGMVTVPALVDVGSGLLERIEYTFSVENGCVCDPRSGQPLQIETNGALAGWGDLSCERSYLIDGRVRVPANLLESLPSVIGMQIDLPVAV